MAIDWNQFTQQSAAQAPTNSSTAPASVDWNQFTKSEPSGLEKVANSAPVTMTNAFVSNFRNKALDATADMGNMYTTGIKAVSSALLPEQISKAANSVIDKEANLVATPFNKLRSF